MDQLGHMLVKLETLQETPSFLTEGFLTAFPKGKEKEKLLFCSLRCT